MHDLNYFRDHLDVFADMATRRAISLDLDAFRALDKERRQLITANEQRKAQRNKASEEIARLKKEKQNADGLIAEMKQVSESIKQSDERVAELDATQRDLLLTIPNLPHSSVPVGASAADNVEVRRWGAPPKFDFQPKPHWEVGEGADILDLPAATKITGARFAVYKGWGARLERALANFFLDVHTREHGYTEILPPFLVNTASLMGAGQLPKFAADLFKIQDTDFWLTPTSEVELHNLYRDETIPEEKLPRARVSYTKCGNHTSKIGIALSHRAALHRRHGVCFGQNIRHRSLAAREQRIPRNFFLLQLRSVSIPPRRHPLQAKIRRQERLRSHLERFRARRRPHVDRRRGELSAGGWLDPDP